MAVCPTVTLMTTEARTDLRKMESVQRRIRNANAYIQRAIETITRLKEENEELEQRAKDAEQAATTARLDLVRALEQSIDLIKYSKNHVEREEAQDKRPLSEVVAEVARTVDRLSDRLKEGRGELALLEQEVLATDQLTHRLDRAVD